MFIRSARLFLRPPFPEDREAVLVAIRSEAITRQLASAPWPYTSEDAGRFVARPQDSAVPHFLLTLPGEVGAPVIGAAGLIAQAGGAELGFWITRPYWGLGYATEAACAVLEIAQMLGHRRITASRFTDNPASARVLEKAGFAPTGETAARFSCGRGGHAPAVLYRWNDGCADRLESATSDAA